MYSFEKFCGGQFWNQSLTWDTSHPDLTSCFENSILNWTPAGFLLLVAPFYYLGYLKLLSRKRTINTALFKAKIIFSIILLLVSIVTLIYGCIIFSKDNIGTPLIAIISPAINAFTFLVSTLLIWIEQRKRLTTSGIHFIFYFLLLACGFFILYSYLYRIIKLGTIEYEPDIFIFVTFMIHYFFVCIQFLIFCFADSSALQLSRHPLNKALCPEVESSFFSRITFWWMNGLIIKGYKKALVEDDLWRLNPRDITANNVGGLERAWQEELRKCAWESQNAENHGSETSSLAGDLAEQNERTGLLQGSSNRQRYMSTDATYIRDPQTDGRKKKEPSLMKVVFKVYGPTLLLSHLCKIVCDLLTFVGPILQSQLISFTENPKAEQWKGILYAVLFFLTSIVNAIFFHQVFHIGNSLGMRIKASVISIVYKKALSMSNESRKTTTVGEIVNLMSVDAQRLLDATGYLWMLWSSPLQIILAVVFLWRQVGPSVLAGLGIMVLLIPINGLMASRQRKLQVSQMKRKDDRIKLLTEILNGIKVLKLYAWEMSFEDKVKAIRNIELETLRKYCYLGAVGSFLWTCAPFLVTLATFTTYVLSGGVLDANKAFTALSLFNILRFPINALPMMLSFLITASVSIKRIGKFLQNKDIDQTSVDRINNAAYPISIRDGTFAWGTGSDDLTILNDVNINVDDKSLTAIVGPVGAGKSTLISAILGETEKLNGQVTVKGNLAYVAQQAWIQNATLKDNILFGMPFDDAKYNKVLDDCALRPDLDILPGGDLTEIGEKGINLSGGQKQRVSLARAIYQDCDIYLLDDPLSAVDSHVGKHIFNKVIGPQGCLSKKTRIFVTHGIHFLSQTDCVVVLSDGKISEIGPYADLLSHNGEFARFLKNFLLEEKEEYLETEEGEKLDPTTDEEKLTETELEVKKIHDEILQRVSSLDEGSPISLKLKAESLQHSPMKKQSKLRRGSSLATKEKVIPDEKKDDTLKKRDRIIQDETSETGKVSRAVYISYCKSLGYVASIFLLLFFLSYQAASILSSFWLSTWTADPVFNNASVNSTEYINVRNKYLGIYAGLGGAQAFFVLIFALIFAESNVGSSRAMHTNMLHSILRSPMSFFETTPTGRIINRFSRDIEVIDNTISNQIKQWMNTFFSVIATVIVVGYSTPIFLSVVFPLFILYYLILFFYMPTNRQLKRLESTTRSPIYVHFGESIGGASTIRAFNRFEQFCKKSDLLVDNNNTFYFANIASNRWLGFRLEVMGGVIIFSAAIFAVIGHNTLTGSIVGLSISYALQVTGALNWMVRVSTDLESNIVSVERIKEYSETPSEADWDNGSFSPPRNWPQNGKIEFVKYSARYRPELDLSIRSVDVSIKAGEKVGICGRTGAGKSSLTLALFRLVESAEGRILLDDVDIANLALYKLRTNITILPQDPVIFSGTLRMNLDPVDSFTDAEIWGSLELAHLKTFVASLPAGLQYECGEGGQNLSVGQRQLLCLARTLLRKTKILVLDEATAAVDLETDTLIQETIRKEFAGCTVLTIAHRLNTIIDSDRVMVLDSGKLCEYDSPSNLLDNNQSKFYSLAKDAGIAN